MVVIAQKEEKRFRQLGIELSLLLSAHCAVQRRGLTAARVK